MADPQPLWRVWIDAQLPPALARWLRGQSEVDAAHVAELNLLGAPDALVFDRARAAGAVVITKDIDFVHLLEQRGSPPQLIWVTCGNVTNHQLQAIMERAWPRAAELLRLGEPLVEVNESRPTAS